MTYLCVNKNEIIMKATVTITKETIVKREDYKTVEGLGVGLFTTLDGTVIIDERIGQELWHDVSTQYSVMEAKKFGSLRALYNWKA